MISIYKKKTSNQRIILIPMDKIFHGKKDFLLLNFQDNLINNRNQFNCLDNRHAFMVLTSIKYFENPSVYISRLSINVI